MTGNVDIVTEAKCFQRTNGGNKEYLWQLEENMVIDGKMFESCKTFRGVCHRSDLALVLFVNGKG